MKYAFAGAALVAGAFAVPAWAPGTETVEVTTLETITSCGPEVTNCPARSSSAAWTESAGGWTDTWSDSWATSTSSVASSTASSTTSSTTSAVTSPVTTSAPVTVWSTSTSTTPVAPVTPSSSSVSTSPVSPVTPSSSSSLTWTYPVGPTGVVPTGGYAHGSSSCGPGHPGWPGYSGTAPAGGAKPTGTGTGTGVWSYPSASSSPITPSTGGAAQNAAGLLAGLGAIAAFFL